MNKAIIFIMCIFLFSFSIEKWEPGETDSKGNLIIVKLKNKKDCKDREQFQTFSVDMDWSILLFYDDNIKSYYFIFNNIKKQIFRTKSFERFLEEIKKIPNNTMIRNIEKCSAPFSYMMPEDLRDQLYTTIQAKNCILEEKIMYCYCFAEKIDYKFLKN